MGDFSVTYPSPCSVNPSQTLTFNSSFLGMVRDGWVWLRGAGGGPAGRKKKIVKSSWVLLECSGKETLLNVDEYSIIEQVQIRARDLRILEPSLSYPSNILGRQKAIILNLEHIKAIITAEKVLVRDPSDENVIPVVEELKRRLPNDDKASEEDGYYANVKSPFEFRALEVAMETICNFFYARTTQLENVVYVSLDELTNKVCSSNLDSVRKLKSDIIRLTARVQKVRDVLEQLLDDDDDMADLYLSRKLTVAYSPSRTSIANDVEELEMLLEAYFIQIDGTLTKLSTLRKYIADTENLIHIQLLNRKSKLIKLKSTLTTGNFCSDIFSLVTSIFGMNIPYTWNDNHGYMFKWVCIANGVGCVIIFFFLL